MWLKLSKYFLLAFYHLRWRQRWQRCPAYRTVLYNMAPRTALSTLICFFLPLLGLYYKSHVVWRLMNGTEVVDKESPCKKNKLMLGTGLYGAVTVASNLVCLLLVLLLLLLLPLLSFKCLLLKSTQCVVADGGCCYFCCTQPFSPQSHQVPGCVMEFIYVRAWEIGDKMPPHQWNKQ